MLARILRFSCIAFLFLTLIVLSRTFPAGATSPSHFTVSGAAYRSGLAVKRVPAQAASLSPKPAASVSAATTSTRLSCGAWNAVASPSPGQDNRLYGVAALSARNAWAVGSSESSGVTTTLIEHWNGKSWSIVTSSNPTGYINVLDSITAVSASDVWAVGYSYASNSSLPQTLTEQWNGSSWQIVPSPNAGAYSILSSVVRVPNTNGLWAVGNYYSSPSDSVQKTLVEQWNGSNWSFLASPNVGSYTNELSGVTALSASNIWVVGAFDTSSSGLSQTLIEHWDGTSWNVITSPNPGETNVLASIARVPGSKQVWAVGNDTNTSGSFQTLIEQWNGTSWSAIPSPNGGVNANTFEGVAAISVNDVWAIGYSSNNLYQTLIEQWNGTSWSVISSPNPGTTNDLLHGITRVPGSGQLWSVGSYSSGNGSQTLIEYYC